jgi:hypothetical protein
MAVPAQVALDQQQQQRQLSELSVAIAVEEKTGDNCMFDVSTNKIARGSCVLGQHLERIIVEKYISAPTDHAHTHELTMMILQEHHRTRSAAQRTKNTIVETRSIVKEMSSMVFGYLGTILTALRPLVQPVAQVVAVPPPIVS